MTQLRNLIFKNGALYDRVISSSRMLCHIDDNKIYEGTVTSSSHVLCTIKNGKIYKGTVISSSKQLGFIDDAKAYMGTVKSSSKVALTFKNGNIYEGGVVSSSKSLGNIKGAEYLLHSIPDYELSLCHHGLQLQTVLRQQADIRVEASLQLPLRAKLQHGGHIGGNALHRDLKRDPLLLHAFPYLLQEAGGLADADSLVLSGRVEDRHASLAVGRDGERYSDQISRIKMSRIEVDHDIARQKDCLNI